MVSSISYASVIVVVVVVLVVGEVGVADVDVVLIVVVVVDVVGDGFVEITGVVVLIVVVWVFCIDVITVRLRLASGSALVVLRLKKFSWSSPRALLIASVINESNFLALLVGLGQSLVAFTELRISDELGIR